MGSAGGGGWEGVACSECCSLLWVAGASPLSGVAAGSDGFCPEGVTAVSPGLGGGGASGMGAVLASILGLSAMHCRNILSLLIQYRPFNLKLKPVEMKESCSSTKPRLR